MHFTVLHATFHMLNLDKLQLSLNPTFHFIYCTAVDICFLIFLKHAVLNSMKVILFIYTTWIFISLILMFICDIICSL